MPLGLASTGIDGLLGLRSDKKLEIHAFTHPSREASTRVHGGGFRAQISPSSIKLEYKNNLTGRPGMNGVGSTELDFNYVDASYIKFKLILTDSDVFHYSGKNVFKFENKYFDDTGVKFIGPKIEGDTGHELNDNTKSSGSVSQGIERFLNLTTQKSVSREKVDTVAYLGIQWGDVFTKPNISNGKTARNKMYPCYLESVNISYTQFSASGRALRAELDCVFKGDEFYA